MAIKSRKNINLYDKNISGVAKKKNVTVDIYELSTKDKIESIIPEASNFFSSSSSELYSTIPTISTNSSVSNITQKAKKIAKNSIRKKEGNEKTLAVKEDEILSKKEPKVQNDVLKMKSTRKKKNNVTKPKEKSPKIIVNKMKSIKKVVGSVAKNKRNKKLVEKESSKIPKKDIRKKKNVENKAERSQRKTLVKRKVNKNVKVSATSEKTVVEKNPKKDRISNSIKCCEETKLPESQVESLKRRCASTKSCETRSFKTLSNVSSGSKSRKSC